MELTSNTRYSVLKEKASEKSLSTMESSPRNPASNDAESKTLEQDLDSLVLQTLPSVDYSTVSSAKPSKSRFLLEKILLLTILALLFVIFVLALISINFKKDLDKKNKLCTTGQCLIVAASIRNYLNPEVDPCDDFYEYSCGGWVKKNLIPTGFSRWGTLSMVTYENNLLLKEKLEANMTKINENLTEAEFKAKRFYTSCMDKKGKIETLGARPLLNILDKVMYKNKSNKLVINETFTELLKLVQREYGVNSLFEFNVLDDDKNSSYSNIEIIQGSLGLERSFYINNSSEKNNKVIEIYKKTLVNVLNLLFENIDNASKEVEDLFEFETKLANIMLPSEKISSVESSYSRIKMHDLNNEYATFFNWTEFLNSILKKYGSREVIKENDAIIVMGLDYFKDLNELIKEYRSSPEKEKILKLSVITQLIKFSLPLLSKEYRDQFTALGEALTGSNSAERWQTCLEHTDTILGLGFALTRIFLRVSPINSKTEAQKMIRSIKNSFVENFPQIPWMDDETRRLAEDKVNHVDDLIGYPDFVEKDDLLNRRYKQLSIDEEDYFGNEIRLVQFALKNEVTAYRTKVNRAEWEMTSSAVNAYYSPTRNQIVFPSGILKEPFFHPKNPMSVNYGSIGSIMGHELTHGFDNSGREYDKNGIMHQWWNNKTIEDFKEASKCMVEQYSKYKIVDEDYLNGNQTLGENIADNGGLRSAFYAYVKWIQEHGEEKKLPLLNLSNRQIFFVSFAQTWCSKITSDSLHLSLSVDQHSPPKYRVLGTISNSDEFAEAFSCPIDSKMNPNKKCKLWSETDIGTRSGEESYFESIVIENTRRRIKKQDMNIFYLFILLGTAYHQIEGLPSANLSMPFNDVIILSSKNLNCHSCARENLKTPECTCQSSKCVLKSFSNNSTFISDRSCTDEPWLNNLLYDGCLTYSNKYWCICSSDYCNDGNLTAIRGNDDCSLNPCPVGSMCLDTFDGFKCMCAPWEPSCTYSQPANCPCRNGGICVQLPSGNIGCSCRYGFTGDKCEKIIKSRKRNLNRKNRNSDGTHEILNLSNIDTITIDESYDLDIGTIENIIESSKPKSAPVKILQNDQNEDYYDYYETIKLVHELESDFNDDSYDDYYFEEDIKTDASSSTLTPDIQTELNNNFYLDPCEPNPCNSGKCEKKDDSFECRCPPGSFGKLCHLSSFGVCPEKNPCLNSGVCMDSDPVFKCICHADFFGTFCEKKINQCLFNNPCHNQATCSFETGSIKCLCLHGYTGINCEIKICDVKNPCLNNGVCIMNQHYTKYNEVDQDLLGVKCFCKPGYEGNRCEKVRYVIGCPPINPCLNNGHCVSKPFGFQCICPRKFTGIRCQLEKKIDHNKPVRNRTRNECSIRKFQCKNKGVCLMTVRGVKCQCLPEYTGKFCQFRLINKRSVIITDQSDERLKNFVRIGDLCAPNPCGNGGSCTSDGFTIKCLCRLGFQGDLCQICDACQPNPCLNNAVCDSDGMGGFSCKCPPGFTGRTCDFPVANQPNNPCHPNPCKNGGQCSPVGNEFMCQCQSEYTGLICDSSAVSNNPCQPNPCKNSGSCVISGYYFNCICPPQFTGTNCDINVKPPNPCDPSPCLNGGQCMVNYNGGTSCICLPGYSGSRCEIQSPCTSNPCKNGGNCISTGFGYRCECPAGTNGLNCELTDPCSLNPCKNNAVCRTSWNTNEKYVCECKIGYTGKYCERSVCEPNPCANFGVCCPTYDGSFTCICLYGYEGFRCEFRDPCKDNPCKNNGKCYREGLDGYKCICENGYLGEKCEIRDNCSPNPCQNSGQCQNQNGGFKCTCSPGFTGERCEYCDACIPNPCQNAGKCTPSGIGGGFRCICPPGFLGRLCEERDPCLNNGQCGIYGKCVVTINGYSKCVCNPGWTGEKCNIREICSPNPCQNGKCIPQGNSYICQCPPGYTGQRCENRDPCFSSPCQNGQCVPQGNSYICQCPPGYTGQRCEIRDSCNPNPCQNGQCVPQGNSYICQCPPGYTGQRCENRDSCIPNPCQNGQCIPQGNSYICQCPPGYTGQRCENRDPCFSSPCQNGQCIPQGNSYICQCPPGYT
ncbi:endothelin-converting enzyme 1 isoform X2, partial [Brachionus plicatilis]